MIILQIMSIIVLLTAAFYMPRFIGCVIIGALLGGSWWWLMVPLAIGGLIIDIFSLAAYSFTN